MKIAIGSDHAGYELKEYLKSTLTHQFEFIDVGTYSAQSCDYPDFAYKVCHTLLSGDADKGILICGTGIGMSIAANRIPGIRAALCHNEFTATRARLHNDSHILAMGGEVVSKETAVAMVRIFMDLEFKADAPENVRHVRRLRAIEAMKQRPAEAESGNARLSITC